jgi:hypothetical protein
MPLLSVGKTILDAEVGPDRLQPVPSRVSLSMHSFMHAREWAHGSTAESNKRYMPSIISVSSASIETPLRIAE